MTVLSADRLEDRPGVPGRAEQDAAAPADGTAPQRRRWRRRTKVVMALAVGWLVSVVLHLLFSGVSFAWLLIDIAPPVAYLVVPVLLLALSRLARPVHRQVMLLAGTALVLGAGLTGLNPHAIVGGGDGSAPADAIRVFSWNTEYWNQADGPDRFYGFLKAQRADIYLLQEYTFWDNTPGPGCLPKGFVAAGELLRLRREFPGYQFATRGELITISRFPIVGTPPVAPDWGRLPKESWRNVYERVKVLRTDLQVGGRVLSTYNLHLPVQLSEHDFMSLAFLRGLAFADTARRDQFQGLRNDIIANRNPVLVAGDFNTSPAMGDMRQLTSVARDAIRANRDLYPQTWRDHSWIPLWRLDWAFTTNGIRVHEYRFVDVHKMSDHRAQTLLVSLGDGPYR